MANQMKDIVQSKTETLNSAVGEKIEIIEGQIHNAIIDAITIINSQTEDGTVIPEFRGAIRDASITNVKIDGTKIFKADLIDAIIEHVDESIISIIPGKRIIGGEIRHGNCINGIIGQSINSQSIIESVS